MRRESRYEDMCEVSRERVPVDESTRERQYEQEREREYVRDAGYPVDRRFCRRESLSYEEMCD